MLKKVVDVLLIQSIFHPDMFRHMVAILRGLCRHLHLMGLKDSPLCRKLGAEDETSAHILCRCEALASSRHAHSGSFFLEPEDIKHNLEGHLAF
jgi:ferredoxin-thioredoxin reductase catalytic subunit